MNKRKVKASKTYICSHCGFEIAVIYDTGDGQVVESRPGKLRPGFGVKVFEAESGRATLVCQDCGKETPVTWLLKRSANTRKK